ncbi:serine/threonine protein kinase [Nocardia yamanashiensis]|uniref:serine/threonine protein kinase n=1 Tax=Nocardia yamanashiensis TaxID=209247 RepID=UPI00082A2C29|nr:serine/threonine protein kinase [Nocardia yamanashiensis]
MSAGDAAGSDIARVRAALPGYEVGGQVGRGGCGVVLAGVHRGLNRRVAIKRIPEHFADDALVRRRFVAEARVMAGLDHPHVVPVYDYIEHEDLCLLVLEYLPGGTVENRFIAAGFEATAAVAVALSCAAGLDAAHRNGILHRDVKPSNLMFAANGTLKLTDFGIAKIVGGEDTLVTRAGEIIGTPSYIAPEQVRGQQLSPATDVYALATMLYQLLSGTLPFPPGEDALAMLFAHAYGDPVPLTEVAPFVPEPIAEVVMRGLAPDPAARFETAESFGVALAEPAAFCWGTGWLTPVGIPVVGADTIVAAATGGSRPLTPSPAGAWTPHTPPPGTTPSPRHDPRATTGGSTRDSLTPQPRPGGFTGAPTPPSGAYRVRRPSDSMPGGPTPRPTGPNRTPQPHRSTDPAVNEPTVRAPGSRPGAPSEDESAWSNAETEISPATPGWANRPTGTSPGTGPDGPDQRGESGWRNAETVMRPATPGPGWPTPGPDAGPGQISGRRGTDSVGGGHVGRAGTPPDGPRKPVAGQSGARPRAAGELSHGGAGPRIPAERGYPGAVGSGGAGPSEPGGAGRHGGPAAGGTAASAASGSVPRRTSAASGWAAGSLVLVRPRQPIRHEGARLVDVDRGDLVPVQQVVRLKPARVPLLAGAVCAVVVGAVAVLGLGGGVRDVPPAGMIRVGGVDPGAVSRVDVDLSQGVPVAVSGVDADSVKLSWDVLGVPVGGEAVALPDGGGEVAVPVPVNQYVVAGDLTGELTLSRNGSETASYRFGVHTEQKSLTTATAFGVLLLVLFAGAYAESNSRALRHGRARFASTVGLAVSAGLLGIAAVGAAWVLLGTEPTVAAVIVCGAVGVGAGLALAAGFRRLGKRYRYVRVLRLREGLSALAGGGRPGR